MFSIENLLIIGFIGVLEVILSVDNALVLAILASRLPKKQQKKALTYGLIGAFVFRFIAIGTANYLIHLNWVKFVGGGYLIWLAMHSLLKKENDEDPSKVKPVAANFWKAVLLIELTDIAFAIDSILAAVALTNQFWIIFSGGILGVVMIRVGAGYFIQVLEKYPRFNQTAYLLVLTIGLKVVLEGFHIPGLDFHAAGSPAFLGFWAIMASCFAYGFTGKDKKK